MVQNVYSWGNIHRFFPSEKVEQLRKQIIEEWKSDKFKDKEIWERYGMSENAFYDIIISLKLTISKSSSRRQKPQ